MKYGTIILTACMVFAFSFGMMMYTLHMLLVWLAESLV